MEMLIKYSLKIVKKLQFAWFKSFFMSKYKIKKNQLIGSPDAETDDLLLAAFISIDNLQEILDTKNQKSILLGRTGSGKSAILKYLAENCDNVKSIDPESMSLRFLSNSTILRYFDSIGVNLNLFYKVLWKHVFIVELLKMYFDENSTFKKHNFFDRLKASIGHGKKTNARKDKAIKYMETWSNDFWQQTEILIKTFEKNIQEKFIASLNIDAEAIKFGFADEKFRNENFVYEAKQKAESIISNSQVLELLDIVEIMKDDLFLDHQRKYYILIDDLDTEWIEDSLRLELIGAMVDVIKEFRQLPGIKIVISLRENLNEIVFSKHQHKGSQREKLKPLYSSLEWTSIELKELVDKRLLLLSENEFNINVAFNQIRRGNKKGLDYVLERTFYRPRDIISFMNHMIENANDKTSFSSDIMSKAEPSYSIERFQALEDEWFENYGKISEVCGFLRGINNGFKLKTISENKFAELYVEDIDTNLFKGELLNAIQDWKKNTINFISFQKKLMYILYRIGILGVKKGPDFPTAFYFTKEVIIEKSDISNSCRFYVHPALYSIFKINVIDQLPEDN
ncbi:hypothetical protein OGH69_11705 [Flavobacterium sp. MFBS3-15]|uniref:P-loop ATPase, Sll1717 family n=1 Tax=Flavobacterium sp. MFBS3-15 TaxID=2989816 RepID=UPI00223607F8|nr:hypothetical protein [Flavobacterium sp. MFBS3-15]MCW4469635.1 hypothetical protein [Flavobacterium sp. MFBS3-15]